MRYLGVFFLICFALIFCCRCTFEDFSEENCFTSETTCPKANIQVFISEDFGDDERTTIEDAFKEWSEKTEQEVFFSLSYVPNNKLSMVNNVSNTFYVFKTHIIPSPTEIYAGWTSWNDRGIGAYILIEPDLDIKYFRPVVLHEIGHALHLLHPSSPHPISIMTPIVSSDLDITCFDIDNFCAIWHCSIDCKN